MWGNFTRRQTLESLSVFALAGYANAEKGAATQETTAEQGEGNGESTPTLNRLATTVGGAEFTGLFLTEAGDFFFNVQHPHADNDDPYGEGTVGALVGTNVNDLDRDFESVQVPDGEQSETVRTAAGTYQPLANGGDETADGEGLGIPYDQNGEPMTRGNNPDFNGFVPAGEREGYLFTNWETVPGMVSRMRLRRNGNGRWNVLEKMNLDFSAVQGTWTNCFGTVSPWGTPLTSEEYEPSAQEWFENGEGGAEAIEEYLGHFGNAYRYGHIVEITEPKSSDPTPEKRYALGRFSHENSVVMPDRRTVYMSDDGTGTVFFKFVADEAGDLSSGTLYAAKAEPSNGNQPAKVNFDLQWVKLAHGTEDQIESWIAEYDGQQPDSGNANYVTDAEVQRWAAGNASDDRAAFLESRKAAAAKGATDEFRKMEGVNIPPQAEPGDHAYMAMSAVTETMADGEGTIQLQGNEYGAVYRLPLRNGYNVTRMEPVVTGGPNANICGGCPYDAAPDSGSSVCASCSFNPAQDEEGGVVGTGGSLLRGAQSVDPQNTIANPDNVVVTPDRRVIVGEDSGLHDTNMLWMYAP